MNKRSVLAVLIVSLFFLLIPLLAMQVSREWNWGPMDFLFAWVMMAGVGLSYKFVTRAVGNFAYRVATALALAAAFMIVWGNLAVGFIGSEDNPANLMYGGVLAVGVIGAAITRFASLGMSHAMFATAFAQFLVPIIALILWRSDFSPGVAQVFGLNFCFVLMFVASALLFRRSAHQHNELRAIATA